MSAPLATELAAWVTRVSYDALPPDVVSATRLRVLDVVGLVFAGLATDFGRAMTGAVVDMGAPGPCRVPGTSLRLEPRTAALTSAALSQALEFDDTHNDSIVHMSSPAVAAALALSGTVHVSGKDFITAIALGNEVSSRVGSVVVGQFHRRGLHPTGLFAPFGICCLAGKLLGLDEARLTAALGIAGSFASGVLECWVDGTASKFLHAGWAAQAGITAAYLARHGLTGPPRVFEGRFGVFSAHLQDEGVERDFGRIRDELGLRWESRNASFKPYPSAHVLHPYIDAALRLRNARGLRPDDIAEVRCPVAEFNVSIVCEPASEKQAPLTSAHGRVSLPYTLAEALWTGRLGREAYSPERIRDPAILELARRIHHYVDPGFPGPGRFRGAVEVRLRNGELLREVQEHNRGSRENPMSDEELRDKFDDNVGAQLSGGARDLLADLIARLDSLPDACVVSDAAGV